jgi:hypothetical protein
LSARSSSRHHRRISHGIARWSAREKHANGFREWFASEYCFPSKNNLILTMSDRNNNSFRDFGNLSSLEDQKLKSASSVNSQEFIQQIESRWQDAVEKK